MTLHELERLVGRIEEALERPVTDGTRKLAADYSAVGRAAVTRLGQCAAMLDKGEEHQALQLAEAQPALLDVITLLTFRRSPNWRALCRAENWPTPEAIDVKALRRLNELYGKGIDKDHALYRDYRRAVMLNDDARALGILRSIVRLNPSDQNARGECERLESKQRTDKARELEKLVRMGGEPGRITRLAEEVEATHVAVEPALWEKAQTIRANALMARTHDAQRAGDLHEVQHGLEILLRLKSRLKGEDQAELEVLERWAGAEAQRHKEEAGRRAAMEHLAAVIHRLEPERGERKRGLSELRAALASLENAWRQAERLRVQIRPDLTTKTQKLRSSLNAEITHRVRASRAVGLGAVAAVVSLCAVSAWFAYSRHAANAADARIQTLMSERRVAEVELIAKERRDAAVTKYLQRELGLKAASDEIVKSLEDSARSQFTNSPPEQIAAAFERARQANAALAPEFRATAEADLAKQKALWNEFIERERGARTAQLSSMLTPLEASAEEELQFKLPADRALKSAERLRVELAPARKLIQAPILKPKQEALFRFENLEARIQKVSRDATNWFEATETLRRTTNWEGYNAGLQQLISSGFTPAAQREAAGAFGAMNLSSKSVLAPLLLPNAPAALMEPVPISNVPQNVLPAEREVLRRLQEDRNIQDISRMEIQVKALPVEDPRRRRIVFVRGELQRRVTRKSGQIYDPIESPNSLVFVDKEMSSLDFSLEEPGSTPERDLYERVGLNQLIDSNTGAYQASLLQGLDEVSQDRRANPLFRAYLFEAICQIMDAQPLQWGAVWSPSLARDRAELKRLGGRQIGSGDWMVPGRVAPRGRELAEHFERAALQSYAREAAFFRRLLPKAVEAGARVVGYVSADGKMVLRESEAAAVWGFTSTSRPAEIVMIQGAGRRAIPFSPLFVFGGEAARLADEASQALGYSPDAVGVPENLPEILKGGF